MLTEARLRLYEAIDAALERWPEVSALAWEANSRKEFIAQLGVLLEIDQDRAEAVADLQVRRVPRDQRAEIREQLAGVRERLDELRTQRADGEHVPHPEATARAERHPRWRSGVRRSWDRMAIGLIVVLFVVAVVAPSDAVSRAFMITGAVSVVVRWGVRAWLTHRRARPVSSISRGARSVLP